MKLTKRCCAAFCGNDYYSMGFCKMHYPKIFTFLKELMSAQYNPSTNKITGCTEGSLIYNHEYRHFIQQDKYKYFTFVTLSIWIGLYLLIISENYKISYILLLLLILPEIDAWIYAIWIKYHV